jgi:peptide/nickel transport system permease protein
MDLWRYLGRRLILSLLTLFGVVVAVFVLTHILPGNPAEYRAGAFAPEEAVKEIEIQMGLDKPLPVQFATYFGRLLHGDLGQSWTTRRPVSFDLLRRLPATLELATASFLIALVVGFPLGVAAAVKKDSAVDHLCRMVTSFSASVALFWLGTMLIYVLYYEWQWLPAPAGRLDIQLRPPETLTGFYVLDSLLSGDWAVLGSSLGQLFLPALTLSFAVIGATAKAARTSMLEVLHTDYIRTWRALGLSRSRVVLQEALPNALIPIITILAIVFAFLMGGNVIVEMLFSWPGIGNYAWNALSTKDFDAVQGFMLVVATGYVLLNMLADILYGLIDPRIRLGARA